MNRLSKSLVEVDQPFLLDLLQRQKDKKEAE
jgi:hypothetical protein